MSRQDRVEWSQAEEGDVARGLRRLQRSARLGVVIAAVGACVLVGLAVALYAGRVSGRVSMVLVGVTLGVGACYLLVDRWIEGRIERAAGEIEALGSLDDDEDPAR